MTVLHIWTDPRSDIGLDPRNNWCVQSQIGSPPKIWAYYFIRWIHVLGAKIICVSNTEIQILVVLIMLGNFRHIQRGSQTGKEATFTCNIKNVQMFFATLI